MNQQADQLEGMQALLKQVESLRIHVEQEGQRIYDQFATQIKRQEYDQSAKNLSHYLALRQKDIRDLQVNLIPYGLSSLGRLESKTLSTLKAVEHNLKTLLGLNNQVQPVASQDFKLGQETLKTNTDQLFGSSLDGRRTRIMVTMPPEAADDDQLIQALIKAGMNVARINCAHDQPQQWQQMIERIRKVSQKMGQEVKILMDVAGPKIRTEWVFTELKQPRVKQGDRIALTIDHGSLPLNRQVNVTVGCSVPQVFEVLKPGDRVLIDDGSVETQVDKIAGPVFYLTVTKTKGKSVRIKSEKGLNFPGIEFDIDILTDEDRQAIRFAAKHADLIGFSFIRNAKDIQAIQAYLDVIGQEEGIDPSHLHLLVKIETLSAVTNIAEIIVQAAGHNPFAIMIARGDLAVETGYIKLAEVQQKLLWISEAGDIPVVWGTEVLDNLIKTGIPTRAEVTDASTSATAECVMLNKGSYQVEAVEMLAGILNQMEAHQFKKTQKMRSLDLAQL